MDMMEDVDVELGNIQDSVEILLDRTKNATNRSSSASVRMVPSSFRDLNPSVFTPRVVSIGPLHRMHERLVAFEEQKAVFLRDVLLITGLPPEQTLKTCLLKVNGSVHRIRAFYGGVSTYYSDDEFARMMVMDACFILEYLYRIAYGLCDENMVLPAAIVYDLLLIENQIPFFVLQGIFECTYSRVKQQVVSLNELIFFFVHVVNIFESNLTIKNDDDTITCDHILGFIHECYRPPYPPPSAITQFPAYSATDLDRAGVNFKPHHGDAKWPIAMKLESLSRFLCFSWRWRWAKPTLRMPKLFVTSETELILRNLIAYEQFTPQVRHYITSYATAMDMLINTEEDVSILVESNVLVNSMGLNQEVAKMINHVCDGARSGEFFYHKEWQGLDTYYNGNQSKNIAWFNIAWLRRTYFGNPWNMIALLAGILLFVLTLVQTYFTIKPI